MLGKLIAAMKMHLFTSANAWNVVTILSIDQERSVNSFCSVVSLGMINAVNPVVPIGHGGINSGTICNDTDNAWSLRYIASSWLLEDTSFTTTVTGFDD